MKKENKEENIKVTNRPSEKEIKLIIVNGMYM